MNRRVMLKTGLFIVLLGISMSGCTRQSTERVQWQGLCIPKDKVGWLQSGPGDGRGGLLSNMFSQAPGLDKSAVPKVTVTFSGAELAAAIPGYTPTVPTKWGRPLTLGSVVSIKPMKYAKMPHQEAYVGIFRDVWNLSGTWGSTWAGSKIVPLKGTSYYKVIPKDVQLYDSWFALTTINPANHQPHDPPFENTSAWYIGTCGTRKSAIGLECKRALLHKKFYLEYTVERSNLGLIDEIDQFMLKHIQRWAKACEGSD